MLNNIDNVLTGSLKYLYSSSPSSSSLSCTETHSPPTNTGSHSQSSSSANQILNPTHGSDNSIHTDSDLETSDLETNFIPVNSDSDADTDTNHNVPVNSDSDSDSNSDSNFQLGSNVRESDPDPITTDDITINESLFEPLYEGAGITICGAYCAIMEFKRECKLPFTTVGKLLELLQLLCPSGSFLPKSVYRLKSFFQKYSTGPKLTRRFCPDCSNELTASEEMCARSGCLRRHPDCFYMLRPERRICNIVSSKFILHFIFVLILLVTFLTFQDIGNTWIIPRRGKVSLYMTSILAQGIAICTINRKSWVQFSILMVSNPTSHQLLQYGLFI